jgi:tryptophanyl-tRNA synthetase
MSKSLDNAIFLSDDGQTVRRKVMGIYTDPGRVRATDPGRVEGNPLWVFHRTFNPDQDWVNEHEDLYRRGMVGDVEIKRRLVEVLDALLTPIRYRRARFASHPSEVLDALHEGTRHAIDVTEETLAAVKRDLRRDTFTPVTLLPQGRVSGLARRSLA